MKDELGNKTDRSLDERFQSRPHVYARLQRIADMMDQAIAEGATADEAEELAIEQIHKLGQDVLNDWSKEKHRQALAHARTEHPQATKHAKKK
jgi:hypothetical protein